MDAPNAETPTYPITSVDNALRLLLLVGERSQLRIAEASAELDVARSTAHRLMRMLQFHGFVHQDRESKAYLPGPVLVNMGLNVVRNLDIRALARPYLESLVEQVDETVHLLELRRDAELTCLDSIETTQPLRVGARTGMVLPAHVSASGRALLARMAPERLRELYPRARLGNDRAAKIATRAELEAELERVRERGFAVQRDETEPDISSVAAAIAEEGRPARYAVTVAVPSARLKDDDVPRIGAAVTATASKIAATLGW